MEDYGPIYPRTPACYGFTIIAKIKPGREERIRAYGKTIETAIADMPDALATLKLHYLRWFSSLWKGHVLHVPGNFRYRFRQVHRGCSSLFKKVGVNTVFENLEGFPEDGKTNVPAFRRGRSRTPVSELFGIR